MIEDKIELITEYGVPVEVRDSSLSIVDETIALIGKASTGNITETSLEYHRIGQFIPGTHVDVGNLVENKITGATYLVLAHMPEVIDNEICAIVTRFAECNSAMSLYNFTEDADENGNIFNTRVDKLVNLPIYIKSTALDLVSTNIGAMSTAQIVIVAPSVDIDVLDTLEVDLVNRVQKLKIESLNYVSYRGLCIIEASLDTRK